MAGNDKDDHTVASPSQPHDEAGAGATAPSSPSLGMNDSPSGKDHPADLGSKAPEPANDDNAPLVCPGCKPNPGGQTGDLA